MDDFFGEKMGRYLFPDDPVPERYIGKLKRLGFDERHRQEETRRTLEDAAGQDAVLPQPFKGYMY